MTRSGLLLGVASVLAGTTVLLAVFGLVYNPILLLAAVPFAAATYLIWSHATGRLEARMRERAKPMGRAYGGRTEVGTGRADRTSPVGGGDRRRGGEGGGARSARSAPGDPRDRASAGRPPRPAVDEGPSRSAAASVLDVDADADEATIRRAFREKARELHPDAPDGDEAEFRRVRTAYERLTDRR